MSNAFDFPGGIYPPERKQRSNQSALIEAPLPRRVTLPLQQHSGQPAKPCVAQGNAVKVGSVIAKREGMVSSALHASISGTVSEVSTTQISIEGDGQDEWLRLPPLVWQNVEPHALLERLNESGIVGLGGAGFPTHIKARVVEQHTIHTLVINAAECEPYITADDLTLRHYANEVLEGAQIIAKLCGAQHIVIGIEDNKPEAIDALKQALTNSQPVPVELAVIATRYPSGGERQLIKKLLDLNVPSGGLPADVGVLCHNPGTLLAILHAVRDGQPLVSRVVTLTGEAITQPGNRWVRLGTSVRELLEQAGLNTPELHQVIQGGPMMGAPLLTLDTPVTKLTNCLIAATLEELPPPPAESPCIRCGECESVCPVALLPQQLHWYARAQDDAKLERYHLFDCIECGACSYVCPSHIPLVVDYREAKSRLRLQRIETAKAEHAKHRFEFRQARLAREEAEKQARKQARQAQQRRPSNTAATNSEKVDLRGLRIAHAAAKASVKKAEKTLARVAQEDPKQSLDDLEMQLATAQENLKAAELQLAQAREQQSSEESP
ncbi:MULTISPECIES: electron transport complex subunit RsxC [Halomonadaceae]|jgi:Na+-translocating ferredoxin:NAD+ oxidoreductase subunit C|uniref:Ion-translocating oxidoreductase complex subunit C n=1 Tax=Vreelandella titanicae TaxID=664683 RepID=A0A653QZK9_9GAMM|nr:MULTISPECIES: electron transport complex subunit RsxC [Halomonas]UEQ06222.1 electron transport complex subunit RsxC [Halomonas profundus]QKS23328.1 Electron transport complex subunit RsxC [Halomonas titanicae]CAD5259925.1 Ion-translocating oxidoreductase complex subunit C [Halomonas sp. 156]CAD5289068.1 Ion-translocating oxidoreductase complex subunit C [Halomonas sp. 113]CAD5290473.1 Ion-translocating oxidoreductase complex subunit C [Halomonas sp. 59]